MTVTPELLIFNWGNLLTIRSKENVRDTTHTIQSSAFYADNCWGGACNTIIYTLAVFDTNDVCCFYFTPSKQSKDKLSPFTKTPKLDRSELLGKDGKAKSSMKRKLSFTARPLRTEEHDSDTGKSWCCSPTPPSTATLLAGCHVLTLPPCGVMLYIFVVKTSTWPMLTKLLFGKLNTKVEDS